MNLNFAHVNFLVDDINNEFALNSGRHISIYDFESLLDFELNEDGETISKGKSIATAVGGVTFGMISAIVGSSGARKNESVCTSMLVRLLMNNLQSPEIVINFIRLKTKKP